MAWTAPATRATGDLITAAQWNAQVPNNMLALAAGCRCSNNAPESIPNNAVTILTFNSNRYDTDTIHSVLINTSRLTCNTAGKYSICGNAEFAASAVGVRSLAILLNGATIIATDQRSATSASVCQIQVACEYALGVGDYAELQAYQNSGGAINVNSAANYSPEFSMHFLGG